MVEELLEKLSTFVLNHHAGDTHGGVSGHLHWSKSASLEAFLSKLRCAV